MADVKEIIPKLIDRTEEGKINWRTTVTEGAFAAVVGNWSLLISIPRHVRDASVELSIHDGQGQLLDRVVAISGEANLNKLRTLHEMAKRSALGVDKQLEGLMAELDRV